jgi:acetyl esterase/lipase
MPSLLMAVDDEILSQPFLQFALSCFTRNGGRADINPLMSPIYCPDELLARLPPMKLIPAEIDALRDQAFYFAHRLIKAGGKCEIYLMKDHIHGFCNIDANYVGVSEFRRSTTMTEQLFRELFVNMRP